MEWIKRRTFEYSLRRARKKRKNRQKDPKLEGASFLLLLSNESDELPDPMQGFVDDLKSKGKSVHCIHYNPSAEETQSEPGLLRLSKKDATWYDKPKSDRLSDLLEKSWDVLICLDEKISRPLRYIIALTNAQLKVGLSSSGLKDFDLLADVETELSLHQRITEVKNILRTVSAVLEHNE